MRNPLRPDQQPIPPRYPIKVLHLFVSLPVGGAEDLLASIMTGLDPARFQAVAACIGRRGPLGEELQRRGFEVVELGLDIKRTPFWHILWAVRRLLRQQAPALLHTHLYHPNLYGRLASIGLGLRGVVVSVHNAYSRVKLHRCLWNYLLAHLTDRLLVSSRQVYQDVRRYDRVPAGKIQVLPYGIRLEEVDCPLTKAEAKAALGISGFCLGTIGRLEEQKGHRTLLAAVPTIMAAVPDLQVLLVGDGRLRPALAQQARELGIEGVVHFLGTRRDLPLLYRAMDIFILPSLWEGLPLVLLKAMAAGLPVIATRVSGVEEVIQDGVNGRLVPDGQAAALAEAVIDLQARPDLWPQWGQAAQLTIAADYTIEAMLAELQALYTNLAAVA
ncbi:MAG: glycosyltransferase [Desulfobacca sp.]|uniref:glycosyltransferase n=1 Tax=Desulfobacca sp. TaxID=2067990 RepID=UPI004049AD73